MDDRITSQFRVLLTGGAGFIGQHVARHFLSLGHEVTSLDRIDEAGSLDAIAVLVADYPDTFRHVWHDLKAPIHPRHVTGKYSHVIHIAAASHVDRSVRDPMSFVADNVTGTAHLLEWVRSYQPQARVLYFSTDEVFGPADGATHEFDEYSPHNPNNPYAASKSAAEQLCPAWANTYGLQIAVSHCTNVYGRGQHSEKFIPLVSEKIRRGELVQIHARDGVPSSRYYLHVSDVCTAVEAILFRGGVIGSAVTGKYNISADEEFSNLEVAKAVAALIGKTLRYELVEFVANRPKHDQRYAVSSNRLKALGWAPQVKLHDGLVDYLEG